MHVPSARFFLIFAMAAAAAQAGPQLVSVASDGKVKSGNSREVSISTDGRFVAFSTTARLTPDDRNTISDVYVRDRVNKTTVRVSDDRGGDHPVISANGRFVAYRSFGGLTRVRVVDLERPGVPVAGAFPKNSSNYDRPSDSAVISPDGRYVGFAFRPTTELVPADDPTRGHQLMVADLQNLFHGVLSPVAERLAPRDSGPDTSIPDLGTLAMSYDGKLVVFQSKAQLSLDDQNDGPDIYLARSGDTGPPQRISKPAGPPDVGTAHDPVISQDGTRIFFICDKPLTAEDTDGRATLYMASGAGFATLTPITTKAVPVSLSTQATITGRYVAFLGRPKGMLPRAIVRGIDTNTETVVPMGALLPARAPVLTGDSSQIAFWARTAVGEQVYVAPVPGVTPRFAPTVVVSSGGMSSLTELVGTDGQSTTFNVGSTAGIGGFMRLLKLEQDGLEIARSTTSTLNFTVTPVRGVTQVRGRGFDDDWIEGADTPFYFSAKPSGSVLAITGPVNLMRSVPGPDGRVDFSVELRIDNTRSTTSGPRRVILTEAPTASIMSGGAAPFPAVSSNDENILAVMDMGALAAGSSDRVLITGHTLPTSTLANPFQGIGWTVLANLRERTKTMPYKDPESPTHPAVVFQTLPRLDENTNLPNGGIPITGDMGADSTFNPATLQSLQIQGRARVGGPSQSSYAARAIFNTATRACIPNWSLVDAEGAATISDTGVVTVRSINVARDIMVHASFFDKETFLPVTLFPLPPKLLVRAKPSTAAEGGDSGAFVISRIGSKVADLLVSYGMEGTAINGVDYTLLDGVATIPAGAASVTVPLVPTQDVEVEGIEKAMLRLAPDPLYRLSGASAATVVLSDDDPLKDDQPDLSLRHGARAAVGSLSYQTGDVEPDEIKQILPVNVVRARKDKVTVRIVNRGTTPQSFVVQGGPGGVGFTLQYLSGQLDVTESVVAGTFSLATLMPGAAASFTVAVLPTADAPIGGTLECAVRATGSAGTSDVGLIEYTRVH